MPNVHFEGEGHQQQPSILDRDLTLVSDKARHSMVMDSFRGGRAHDRSHRYRLAAGYRPIWQHIGPGGRGAAHVDKLLRMLGWLIVQTRFCHVYFELSMVIKVVLASLLCHCSHFLPRLKSLLMASRKISLHHHRCPVCPAAFDPCSTGLCSQTMQQAS